MPKKLSDISRHFRTDEAMLRAQDVQDKTMILLDYKFATGNYGKMAIMYIELDGQEQTLMAYSSVVIDQLMTSIPHDTLPLEFTISQKSGARQDYWMLSDPHDIAPFEE